MGLGLGLEAGVGFVLADGRQEGRAEEEHAANWVGIFETWAVNRSFLRS